MPAVASPSLCATASEASPDGSVLLIPAVLLFITHNDIHCLTVQSRTCVLRHEEGHNQDA